MDQNEQASFESLIDKLVALEAFPGPDTLDRKIELLCFALDELKFKRAKVSEEITFEQYVQCDVRLRGSRLKVTAPARVHDVGSGIASIHLQAPLLLFLLLNHKERYKVLEIIGLFIENVRSQLSFLDFKKTKTGVTRCFTNTRFAANVLRNYGLLRFTKLEAFKTWELSLPGFLVAASLLERRAHLSQPWYELGIAHDWNFDLLPEIHEARKGLSSFDEFVSRLASICQPDAAIFKSFKPALEHAFRLLQGYWDLLSDPTKSQEERQSASLEKIKQLDSLGEDFFMELSRCIQINDVLLRAVQAKRTADE